MWVKRVPFSMAAAVPNDGPLGGISAPVNTQPVVALDPVDGSGDVPALGVAAAEDVSDVAAVAKVTKVAKVGETGVASVAKGKSDKGAKEVKGVKGVRGLKGGEVVKKNG